MFQLDKVPFFEQLTDSQNILVAGAGGGFDIYSGIPIYLNLKQQGKNVILGNLSFTWLSETTAEQVWPYCYKIKINDMDLSGRNYFPELYLCQYLEMQGIHPDMYAFEISGVMPLTRAYQYLIKEHKIDTIILVDGGTDSLMFGDEQTLGTPMEDICSMAAVYNTGIDKQYLLSVGFGIDHFHGVSHYRFLENVAELAKEGGYLGLFQITKEMTEGKKLSELVAHANKRMHHHQSIVANSIVSALDGEYGDYHRTNRTRGSELWINPLMTIYWAFELQSIIAKNRYYEMVKDTEDITQLHVRFSSFRKQLKEIRRNKQMPI